MRLQDMLSLLYHDLQNQHSDAIASHNSAVQVSTQQLGNSLELVISSLSAAAITSSSLQKDIVSITRHILRSF